jgi:hypothetical protein
MVPIPLCGTLVLSQHRSLRYSVWEQWPSLACFRLTSSCCLHRFLSCNLCSLLMLRWFHLLGLPPQIPSVFQNLVYSPAFFVNSPGLRHHFSPCLWGMALMTGTWTGFSFCSHHRRFLTCSKSGFFSETIFTNFDVNSHANGRLSFNFLSSQDSYK